MPVLEGIAPVLHVEAFDAGQDNARTSRRTFAELSERLDRGDVAAQRLARLDLRLRAAGARVHDHFEGRVPPVLPIRLLTPTPFRLHGANSMAKAALDGMGLAHPAPGEPTEWGFVQRRVEDLARFEDVIVAQIEPFPQHDALQDTPMWQFMPFVQDGRFATTWAVWTFGGVFSLGYLAEAFADAIVQPDPKADR